MKKLVLLIVFPICIHAAAHPPVGIVCDSKGNIFYSDLVHVWKIDPFGKRTIAVHNVHTHELSIDREDNIFGEQSRYSGEATNKYYHAVWRLNKHRKIDMILPEKEGFYIERYSFVKDHTGTMYWIKHFKNNSTALMKTTSNGTTTKIVDGDFKRVQWMHVVKGKMYYIKSGQVYTITNAGQEEALPVKGSTGFTKSNSLFGIWSDKQGNLYVANATKRMIHKIDPNHNIQTVYTSQGKWFPTGGTFDINGRLRVLECSDKNEIRVHFL